LKQGFKKQFMTPEQKTFLEKRYKQFYVKGRDELSKSSRHMAAKGLSRCLNTSIESSGY
jgi:hypothetical protein